MHKKNRLSGLSIVMIALLIAFAPSPTLFAFAAESSTSTASTTDIIASPTPTTDSSPSPPATPSLFPSPSISASPSPASSSTPAITISPSPAPTSTASASPSPQPGKTPNTEDTDQPEKSREPLATVSPSPIPTPSVSTSTVSSSTEPGGAQNSPSVEDSNNPETPRPTPLNTSPKPTPSPSPVLRTFAPAQPNQSPATATSSLGPNLILNPSFETSGATGTPANWNKGGYGTNTRTLTYPVSGYNSSKAAKATITNFVSGDAKWYPDDVSVTPGKTYQFSDYSLSTVPSIIDARYTMTDGSFAYKYLTTLPASASFQNASLQIVIPANVKSVTIFHLIEQNGSLTVDAYSLQEVISGGTPAPSPSPNPTPTPNLTPNPTPNPTPTPALSNFIQNPDFETADSNGQPVNWGQGHWGTNTAVFTYPVPGVNNSKAAKVALTSRTTGDAKWYFAPVSLPQGSYTYSDQYQSDIQNILTVQFHNADGTYTYKDIATLPASPGSFTQGTADFTVPANTQDVTVFHLINGIGFLTIDATSLISKSGLPKPVPNSIFTNTGAITFRFDDGWDSQYTVAFPKLQNAGIKGTFYIVSQQTLDNDFSGFMSIAQIQNLSSKGEEIGAHTRTHPHLSQLSAADQQDEIQGSRQDILSWNVGPVASFAYPYGDYDTTTLSIVKSAGFSSAASTIGGFVTPSSDKFQLEHQSMRSDTTLAQAKQWIDAALSQKRWLIMTFHRIDTSGNLYSVTPDFFNQIVDYVQQKNANTITVSQGAAALQ